MRKLDLGLIVLALAAVGGFLLMKRGAEPEWTTRSPEALQAFERGLDATMKYYHQDALRHFEEAVELDPEFVTAKLLLLEHKPDKEKKEALLADLRQADRDALTQRERFLLDIFLAQADQRYDEADRLATEFLERRPDDPWALFLCSRKAWLDQDLDRAEKHYRSLIESDPNWVLAQNHLGYLAMARGEFAEAEEMFRTYAYIAPDQANPHDSLGELLTLVGRYEEARSELEQALAIKDDFCASYRHLFEVAILRGTPEDGRELAARAGKACVDAAFLTEFACQVELWSDYMSGDWEAAFGEERQECLERMRYYHLVHRMAVLTGRTDVALEREAAIREHLEQEMPPVRVKLAKALLLHMEGTRLTAAGRLEEAAARFGKADGLLVYWGDGQGIMKLYNRLNLAYALEKAGASEKSGAVVDKVRRVNADFAEAYAEIAAVFDRG